MQGTGLGSTKDVGSFILPSPTTVFDVARCARCGYIDFVALVQVEPLEVVLVCEACGNNVPVPAIHLEGS